MKLNENELPEFLKEMRNLLGNLKVCKGLNETFSLSYVVVVEKEEDRAAVQQVANALTEQAAQKYAIDLQIEAATLEEVKQAQELYKEFQAGKQGSFVL